MNFMLEMIFNHSFIIKFLHQMLKDCQMFSIKSFKNILSETFYVPILPLLNVCLQIFANKDGNGQ